MAQTPEFKQEAAGFQQYTYIQSFNQGNQLMMSEEGSKFQHAL